MENIKVTKEELLHNPKITNEEICYYAYGILGTDNGWVYGRIVEENTKSFQMSPYDVYGKPATLFLREKTCRIDLDRDKDLKIGNYICGRLDPRKDKNKWSYYLIDVGRLDSKEEFTNKLIEKLKKKWESEDFRIDNDDLPQFDGKIALYDWATDYVEAMLERKHKVFNRKIETGKAELEGIVNKIDKKQSELNKIQGNKNQMEEEFKQLKKQIKEAEPKYAHYLELGILSDHQMVPDIRKDYAYSSYEELINQVWGYLWKNENLYYEKAIIKAFMNALRTKQLTLLWGRPGTGKTSLPIKVAHALGAKCIRIQVQSNWTDNQDLIGFFNVVDKRYVSTQFLDALIEAEKNPEQLYFILLDEMNLANVEYYFSEMLNVFTWDKPYELPLYSDRIRTRLQAELKEAEVAEEDIRELVAQLADMDYYKPSFKIPENVRFVGTLNTDATTKTISPKVIDRSCLIELQAMAEEVKRTEAENLPETVVLDGNRVVVKAERFKVPPANNNEDSDLLSKINEIRVLGLPVSNRVKTYINQWNGGDETLIDLDEVVLVKILPAIDLDYKHNHQTKTMIEELKKIIQDCERSFRKIERMEKQATDTERLKYWED